MDDVFRPRRLGLAQEVYDAFQTEAAKRDGRSYQEWIKAERNAVTDAAVMYALRHGLTPPTVDQVRRVEMCACGHIDYAAKWAYGVEELVIHANRD